VVVVVEIEDAKRAAEGGAQLLGNSAYALVNLKSENFCKLQNQVRLLRYSDSMLLSTSTSVFIRALRLYHFSL
jgi:hypothetical protein